MKLNALMLDELVREYCVYRGIVESTTPSSSGRNYENHSIFLFESYGINQFGNYVSI